MKEKFESSCPLCKAKSEYYYVDHGNVKYFKCINCKLFQISEHAERIISNAPSEYLLGLSLQSKSCTKITALSITTVDQSVFSKVSDRAALPQ